VTDTRLDLGDFLSGYVVESDEHLRRSSSNLLAVEELLRQGRAAPRQVRDLYRSLHTIKGLSAMMGLEPVVQLAHAMESVLRAAEQAGGRLPEAGPDLLLRGLRAIEERVAALAAGGAVPAAPEALLDELAHLPATVAGAAPLTPAALELPVEVTAKLSESERTQLASAGARAFTIEVVPSPQRSDAGLDITRVRERVARLGEIVKVVPLSRSPSADIPGGLVFAVLLVSDAAPAAIAEAAGVAVAEVKQLGAVLRTEAPDADPVLAGVEPSLDDTAARRGIVRVEVARLDDALEKLSALVVTRSRLQRALDELHRNGADVRALAVIAHETGRQLRDLRASIMRARLVSAAEMLERLPLLVRGLGRTTGKPVTLALDTGRAELDKSVAERIFPAVIHLVRNAVDHAIEEPDLRQRLGKPTKGTLRIHCLERANNQLELTVEDDGRGIDGAALAARAGREPPTSEEALLALMSLPGLSTRPEAGTTSGRGMGMNIVRRVVEELGGHMSVHTAPGRGTRFVLRIPLSITIVDAFSFRCGSQPFVVPVSVVDEVVEIDPAQVSEAPSGKGRAALKMLDRRGATIPLVALDHVLHLPAQSAALRKAIVVRRNGQPYGFEVDQMLGQQEVVIRPLADPLVRQPGIVGSTDLGDGQPTLVLDLISLCGRLSRRRSDVRT
jgi:two-component system, chemotaxis family, sensor kinase CheA